MGKPRGSGGGNFDADLTVDIEPMIKALRKLDDRGRQLVDRGLIQLAEDEADAARVRAPGSIGGQIEVHVEKGLRKYGQLVIIIGVKMRNANDRVGNWINYGTLGRRVKKKTRKPGTKYDRGPGKGIKPQRFLKSPSKAKRTQALLKAIKQAGRDSGFDVK